jgi:hypothetical protein
MERNGTYVYRSIRLCLFCAEWQHLCCSRVATMVGNPLASVERYDVTSDTWSSVCAMNQARAGFAAHAMVVEMDLFDSLMSKVKSAQRCY